MFPRSTEERLILFGIYTGSKTEPIPEKMLEQCYSREWCGKYCIQDALGTLSKKSLIQFSVDPNGERSWSLTQKGSVLVGYLIALKI